MMNAPVKQVPRTKDHYFKIEATKIDNENIPETEVNITLFTNRVFIIITQLDKMGTIVFLFDLNVGIIKIDKWRIREPKS